MTNSTFIVLAFIASILFLGATALIGLALLMLARTNRMDREFKIAMQLEKNKARPCGIFCTINSRAGGVIKGAMSDHAELQSKILTFLMAEWVRKDNRQLVAVDLIFSPGGGFRDEEVRTWVRADEPELFAEFVHLERLVTQIIEIAAGEADAKPAGKHRFIVRCKQHGGTRPTLSFTLSPSYDPAEAAARHVLHIAGTGSDKRALATA